MIGKEIAHIRYQHSRVTSDELWAGVIDKGASALETLANVLPMIKFIPTQHAYHFAKAVVPLSWLKKIYEVEEEVRLAEEVASNIGKLGEHAGEKTSDAGGFLDKIAFWTSSSEKGTEENLSVENSQLLAAHRAMQLTADRAGLLLSQDILATLRSMFLGHSSLEPELAIAARSGLISCLSRKDQDGKPMFPDLAIRSATLIAFWLSPDYELLLQASGEDKQNQ